MQLGDGGPYGTPYYRFRFVPEDVPAAGGSLQLPRAVPGAHVRGSSKYSGRPRPRPTRACLTTSLRGSRAAPHLMQSPHRCCGVCKRKRPHAHGKRVHASPATNWRARSLSTQRAGKNYRCSEGFQGRISCLVERCARALAAYIEEKTSPPELLTNSALSHIRIQRG